MGWDAPWHWVVIAILVIALFGYKRMPDAARSLGRSLRIFKTEIKGMTEDDKSREVAAAPAATTPPAAEAAPAAQVAPVAQVAPAAQTADAAPAAPPAAE